MPRPAPVLIAALALAAALGGRPPLAAHAAELARSHPPAAPAQATDTPTPTETPTPGPAPTATPPWLFEVTLPAPALGTVVRIERRWSYGEMANFFAVVGLGVLLALRWAWDWIRAEMVKPVDPRAD